VYLVDDDDAVRESLKALLEAHGLPVEAFACGEAFQRRAAVGLAGCLILDLQLPNRNGMHVMNWLRNTIGSNLPVLMITGHGDEAMRATAQRAGVDFYVEKPFDAAALTERVMILLGRGRTGREMA
jgi:FixJ family two-component response regulator